MTRRDALWLAALAGVRLKGDEPNYSRMVYPGSDGRLVYAAGPNGDRIPDFSNCGYMGGGVPIPDVPVRATVEAESGDATERVQRAIDDVSSLDMDESGFRGAVLLERGRFDIGGTLRIAASGIVLRGQGQGEDGTILTGTGRRQRNLIEVRGLSAGRTAGKAASVAAEYVPVGERSMPVDTVERLSVGDTVIVRRASNAAWIREIGMDRIPQRPDDPASTVQWTPFNLDFERRVEAVEGGRVVLDAPITCAIDARWGGGEVLRFEEGARLFNVGVENLRGVSEFDSAVRKDYNRQRYHADEQHAWTLIAIDNANNVWVQDVAALHFGFACVDIGKARWVTVQDCRNGEMVSEITGSRRYSFNVEGQLCLIQRCASDSGRHDFVAGARICGPNVFLDSTAGVAYATSEPHHRWSTGGLYDSVKAPIAFQDRAWYGTGHGWSGANYVAWNTEGSLICQQPPTAQNWAIGHVGQKVRGDFEPRPEGYWESLGRHVEPASLYLAQLAARLGGDAVRTIAL